MKFTRLGGGGGTMIHFGRFFHDTVSNRVSELDKISRFFQVSELVCSLTAKVTDDSTKQFQCSNIVFDNTMKPIFVLYTK